MKRAAPHRGQDVHYGEIAEDDERPSRSQLKRESTALQVLGTELADMPAEKLAQIEMPENLRDAILTWQRTRSHEGRRRQMQYVGKLMRQADEAVLREAVAQYKLGSAKDSLQLHEAEAWRAELIASDEALTRFMAQHAQADAQRLRSLVRAARRDAGATSVEQRQSKNFRELFQFIKPLLAEQAKQEAKLPTASGA